MDSTTKIPSRDALLQQLANANRFAGIWILGNLAAIVVLAQLIDWKQAAEHPLLPIIACSIMVGQVVLGLLQLWAQNKIEIGALREQTRFGEFDRHNLRSLFSDTLRRLGLPDDHLPVYITADKSLNAGAMRLGLAGFLKSLNGVYLNRQVLHKLNAKEVQDIMGHELGHYYKYYLVADRFRLLTLLLGATIGIFAVQQFGLENIFGAIALAGASAVFWWISRLPWARHGQAIEYLCDDLGAQVHGVVPSVNGLMKIGAEAEARFAIYSEVLSRKNTGLEAAAIVESIERAIPYGHASRQELEESINRELKSRSQQEQGLSIKGFLKYMWQSDVDDDDSLDELKENAKLLQKIPRLPWESLLSDASNIDFDLARIERLVQMIEANPQSALFRLPDVAGSGDGIHPPLKSRILFLWYNRNAARPADIARAV